MKKSKIIMTSMLSAIIASSPFVIAETVYKPTNEAMQPTDGAIQSTDGPIQSTDGAIKPQDEPMQPSNDSARNRSMTPTIDDHLSRDQRDPSTLQNNVDRGTVKGGVSFEEDRLGVVAFENNSAELDNNAEATLSDIARSLDKQVPTKLVVEVSDPIAVNMDAPRTDAVEGELKETPVESEMTRDINPADMKVTSDSTKQQRAESIRDYLQGQGLKIDDMVIEEFPEATVTSTRQEGVSNKAGDSKASADQSEKTQMIRIVIKEIQMPDQLSAR